MKGFDLSSTLARSVSALAVAAGIAAPGAAFAQAAPGTSPADNAPTNAQPGAAPAQAQADSNPTTGPDIVVSGIRASLERSIAIKRNSFGVVDAISAEDIGKFPDTNLAESLQRIPGVSINRRAGEGADVTVRGFGPQYNMVTLNGRQLAATDFSDVGGDQNGDFGRPTTRSFDFSNLASEGVKTLEVYKTGRAAVPSGGIGAAINVVTRRPLDARTPGLTGSIGAKADYDTSTSDCVSCGSHVTPEVSGLLSWSNPDQNFGVSVFGSYQKRNFSDASATVNGWNISTYAQFIDPSAGNVNSLTKITNAPTDPNQLVARPDDARYHFGEGTRERINGQAVMQFKPIDTLQLTADALFAQNRESERRSDESNWFNRPFDQVTFDTGHSVATTDYLHEVISGATKDADYEQQYRAQKSQLYDFGLNAKWDITPNFNVTLDGHIGLSKSTPDNPNGATSTLVGISAPELLQHSWDYSDNGFPVQTVQFSDVPGGKGNGNGVLDVGDLGSQIGRQIFTSERQRIKEGRVDFDWDLGGGSRFDFGADYRTTTTHSLQTTYQQTLGDWSNNVPGDVEAIAPGLVQPFCLVCTFHQHDTKSTGDGLISFRAEDPTQLYNLLSAHYAAAGNANALNGYGDDTVKEDIFSAYGQVSWKGQLGSLDASLVAGVRYERTKSVSTANVATPADIRWESDNDFITDLSFGNILQYQGKGSYDNVLPSMDFQVNLTHNLIGRLSFSKTLSRPQYGNLFASSSVSPPNDATAVGGQASGSTGNPSLRPLTSDNLDLSVEWYFKRDSYVSVGLFDKRVHNFIGNTVVKENLFGLRDPSAAAPGSRSGTAKTQLQAIGADISDVNLYTYTTLLAQNNGNTAVSDATFLAHYNTTTHQLDNDFQQQEIAAGDIIADANDPLFIFNVTQPINNKDAEIYGAELQGQYFFGNSGIGIAAAYTLVRGNIGIDVAAPTDVDQFALVGLSDTANATLIYDKYGISARLAYNWRGKFLSAINRDGFHSPEFTAPYGQLDLNVSYDVTKNISVSFEGINLTKEGVKTYGRSPSEIWLIEEGSSRYLLGARMKF